MFDIHSGYSSLPRSTMSEPMGCSNQMNSGFLQDSTIPLLETVSEEARRQTGMRSREFDTKFLSRPQKFYKFCLQDWTTTVCRTITSAIHLTIHRPKAVLLALQKTESAID